jgi:hypothetical protein
VSSEGACAAYYQFGDLDLVARPAARLATALPS